MHFGFYNLKVAAHPHNSFLQIAAEYGLPMALLLTGMLFWFVSTTLRWCRRPLPIRDHNINICLTAALLSGLTDGLFSGNTIMPQSQLLLFFISGWLIGRNLPTGGITAGSVTNNHLRESSKSECKWQTGSQTILVIVIVAALSIQMLEAADYYTFRKRHDFDCAINYHPRYWQDGHRPAGTPALQPPHPHSIPG